MGYNEGVDNPTFIILLLVRSECVATQREGRYKTRLTKRIEDRFPGCMVLRLDPSSLQGVPDILVLWGRHWATLEGKMYEGAPTEPNQPYYVELMNSMSFSAFIHPDNEEEILHALQHAFEVCGDTCVPQRQ